MMNGPEKSDSVVVAVKPANKAGQPAAEWEEPRTGTKRNTGQPHTRRTQSRDSVSQGLDRVRNAAKQRKKEKFTSLLHHITVDLLRESFLALKRRAAPGVGRSGAWAAEFVRWYNLDHRHSGIRYVSPQQRHTGGDQAILAARHALYIQAQQRNPARWSGKTRDWSHIGVVTLNPKRDALVNMASGTRHTEQEAA